MSETDSASCSKERAHTYDAFLSHKWGEGSVNHRKVSVVNRALKKRGLVTWFDEDRLEGNIRHQIADGIEKSKCVLIFITSQYQDSVNSGDKIDDFCCYEFDIAIRQKKVIPIVMEECMKDTKSWSGWLGGELGSQLYLDLSSSSFQEGDSQFEEKCDLIADKVRGWTKSNPQPVPQAAPQAAPQPAPQPAPPATVFDDFDGSFLCLTNVPGVNTDHPFPEVVKKLAAAVHNSYGVRTIYQESKESLVDDGTRMGKRCVFIKLDSQQIRDGVLSRHESGEKLKLFNVANIPLWIVDVLPKFQPHYDEFDASYLCISNVPGLNTSRVYKFEDPAKQLANAVSETYKINVEASKSTVSRVTTLTKTKIPAVFVKMRSHLDRDSVVNQSVDKPLTVKIKDETGAETSWVFQLRPELQPQRRNANKHHKHNHGNQTSPTKTASPSKRPNPNHGTSPSLATESEDSVNNTSSNNLHAAAQKEKKKNAKADEKQAGPVSADIKKAQKGSAPGTKDKGKCTFM